jgi:hypothetical protein
MSPLTLFLAKLIGSLLLIVSAAMAFRKSAVLATSERIIRDPGMVFLTGIMRVAAGLAIVIGHDVWSGGALPIVVTLIGWATLLGGLALLFLSQEKFVETYETLQFERNFLTYLAFTFLLGLYLFVSGFVA